MPLFSEALPKVLVPEKLSPDGLALLRASLDVHERKGLSPDELLEIISSNVGTRPSLGKGTIKRDQVVVRLASELHSFVYGLKILLVTIVICVTGVKVVEVDLRRVQRVGRSQLNSAGLVSGVCLESVPTVCLLRIDEVIVPVWEISCSG